MRQSILTLVLAGLLACVPTSASWSQWTFDVETGAAFNGYNDARIPGDGGTKISLSQELEADPTAFVRFQVTRSFGDRHHVTLLVAPLRIEADGSFNRDVRFDSRDFPAGTTVTSRFRFDSYRLTYRYDIYYTEKVRFGLGLSAKVRDAAISLTSANAAAEKTNTGFVPLINLLIQWQFQKRMGLMLYGDGLAAPQGRAEDFLLAFVYDANKHVMLKAGYRLLEGGADNDEVYTFTLVHYATIGMTIRF